MTVLVIDVGGTNLKVSVGSPGDVIKIPSGPEMTAARMADEVKKAVAGRDYDVVSIGYPGPVVNGRPASEPHNLGAGWMRFDYAKAFGKPVRVVNDAAMQALGSYQGGRMLYLGLGTGLGSAFVGDGVLEPLELAHLPYRKNRTYEDYLGLRGLQRMGRKKWQRHVERVVELLKHGLQADYVMLGGGQTKELSSLPPDVRLGTNAHAILGGIRLWNKDEPALRSS
ncbi:MAG: ROK family protein [Acidobacteria bacterium]|nr:MAG: ROK family protein [Acidobacteriota bacterium]